MPHYEAVIAKTIMSGQADAIILLDKIAKCVEFPAGPGYEYINPL